MHIIVIGCGKVGRAIVSQLAIEEGNDISVVDTNPELIREVSLQYDVMGIVGNGTSYSRITAVAPGTTLEYVASAFNGWQAVKIGSQVGWVSGEFSEITTE